MSGGPPWMALTASDLRLRRVASVVWPTAVMLLVLMIVAVYPSIRDNHSLDSIYSNLSPTAQALLGGSDLTSPVGYLNTQLFAFFLPAVLLVFAVGRGAASIAGEEEERTLDLLLAQPITRTSLYLQKACAVLIGIVVLSTAAWLPIALTDSAVHLDLPLANVAAECLQMGLFCAALAFAAQALAAASGRHVVGVAGAVGYAVIGYVVYGLSATVSWLRPLRPLTLWRWSLANEPLRNGVGTAEVGVLLTVCAVGIAVGMFSFSRRALRA